MLDPKGQALFQVLYSWKSIYFRFSLGPLELSVIKTLGGATKSAKAVTDTMLGLMDMRIDSKSGNAAITNVFFDEPGGVTVTGNLRKRAHVKHNTNGYSPYRYVFILSHSWFPSEV